MQHPFTIGKYFFIGLALIFGILITDQYTKWFMVENLLRLDTSNIPHFLEWLTSSQEIDTSALGYSQFKTIPLLPFLNFTMVWNEGISFGMLDDNPAQFAQIFIIISLAVSFFMLIWLFRTSQKIIAISLSLIIGGALANVLDRIRFRAVADFIDLHIASYHWPVFNFADSCITIGALLLMLDSLLNHERNTLQEKGKKNDNTL